MSLKSLLAKPFAKHIAGQFKVWNHHAIEIQENLLRKHLKIARHTHFGKDHHFDEINSHGDFVQAVPKRDYEQIKPYVERIIEGHSDELWPGNPVYFAKTSGTTSGVKYIPITKSSLPNHIQTARNSLLLYVAKTGNAAFINGKMIFLSGSPKMELKGSILTGRLSGIVNHHVPGYLKNNQLPSFETNCIADWETKVDHIVDETVGQNLTLISGIPPWVQMYYDKLQLKTGKTIKEIFPNLSLFVHGGVNYDPYRQKLEQSMGSKIDTIETYPASEGFIAFQDDQDEEGLLLNINSGIFFEFIALEDYFKPDPKRITLRDVEIGVNYAIILNTNAGLWGYDIGDTVKFVSKSPHRLVVTGRTKQFISAFGEHVIAEEIEQSIISVAHQMNVGIVEFTVAPEVNPSNGDLPYHEWFVEFDQLPTDLDNFAALVDEQLVNRNSYYKDLIDGKVLQRLKMVPLQKDAFRTYMQSIGKLGGQNKVPRLSNDRKIVTDLAPLTLKYQNQT